MRKVRKSWLLSLALLLAAALLVAGCGGDDDGGEAAETAAEETGAPGEEAKPLKVAVFLASAANTYWTAALEGVREAASEAGGDIDITVFDGKFDTNAQKNQLRDALVSKQFDVWFIGPNDGTAIVSEIEEAVGQDVEVGCTLVPCGSDIRATEVQIDGVVAESGIPFFENGRQLGELTAEACEGKDPCKVVWLPGLPSLPLEVARTEGLKSVLDEHSNVRVVSIILLASGGKAPVGTTGAEGSVTVNMNLANVSKGTRVDVYEIVCGDKVVVVLVAQGQEEAFDEECERRMQENGACDCRRVSIGFFIWGDGNVTIDVGTDKVTTTSFEPTTPEPTTGELKAENRWRAGGGFDVRQFFEFEDVSGNQPDATQHDATTWSPGFQLFAEYQILRFLFLGIEGSFAKLETETTFPQGVQRGEIDYLEVGGYGRIPLTRDPSFNAYIVLSAFQAWNRADYMMDGESEHRDHNTARGGVGGGLEYWLNRYLGLRFEGLYNTTLKDGDADEHFRWKIAIVAGKLLTGFGRPEELY